MFCYFPAFFKNFISLSAAATLDYKVDRGENGSPWQLACLSRHVEHPKNTVQDVGVSLVTTEGRK